MGIVLNAVGDCGNPHCRFHPVRILLNNIRWSLMDNKWASEQKLRQSGIPYTVVKPGGLNNGPAGTQQLQAGEKGWWQE